MTRINFHLWDHSYKIIFLTTVLPFFTFLPGLNLSTSLLLLPASSGSHASACIILNVQTGLTESMAKFKCLKFSKCIMTEWMAEWGVWINIFKTNFKLAVFQRERKSPYPSSGIAGCKVLHSLGVKIMSKSSSGKSPSSCASSESKLFNRVIRKPSKSTGSTAS